MARLIEYTEEDAAFDRDPSFRQEVIDNLVKGAQEAGIPIDRRCRRLLDQYADGKISCAQLQHEITRPILH